MRGRPNPAAPHRERRKSRTIICLLSLRVICLFRWKHGAFSCGLKCVKWRDISQTNPVMSISSGDGTGEGGGNLLKWLITMWKWNLLWDFFHLKIWATLSVLLFVSVNTFNQSWWIAVFTQPSPWYTLRSLHFDSQQKKVRNLFPVSIMTSNHFFSYWMRGLNTLHS